MHAAATYRHDSLDSNMARLSKLIVIIPTPPVKSGLFLDSAEWA